MRTISLSLAVLALASAALGEPDRKVRVACIGDSITWGYAMTNRTQESYPVQLQRLLGDRYDVRTFAQPGSGAYAEIKKGGDLTSWDVPWTGSDAAPGAYAFEPDIVISNLGINDCCAYQWEYRHDEMGRTKTPEGTFRQDYTALLKAFERPGKPRPRYIIWTKLGPIGKIHCLKGKEQPFLIEHDLKAVAKAVGAEGLDMYTPLLPFAETAHFAKDGIHPEGGAQRVIAEVTARQILGATTAPSVRELRVTPTGLSPVAALLKIRVAKASGDRSAWTVRVAPGFYELTQPLTFLPEDSGTPSAPVRWIADGGEVVFVGGSAIADWRDDGDGTWSAPVPKDGLGKPIWFQSLFVNGRRAVRARQPNQGFFHVDAWHQAAVTNRDGVVRYTQYAVISNAAADVLANLPDRERAAVELQARVKWSYGAFSVAGWDPASRTLTVDSRADEVKSWKSWQGPENLFCLENVRAGFDAPGEWFYDVTAGRVRYRPLPGETLAASTFRAPTAQLVSVVRLTGDPEAGKAVTDISFEGLAFALTRTDGDRLASGFVQQYQLQAAKATGGCVYLKGVQRVAFERCRVTQTENYAFRFDIGCVSNRVVGCEMTNLGAGGVMIGDMRPNYYGIRGRDGRIADPGRIIPYGDPLSATFRPCAFITVDDCTIAHAGLVNPEACGVLVMQASDCTVTHCDIHDLYYTGVSVGWTWGYSGSLAQRNTIAFNRIWDLGKGVMSDMGGVYTLGTSFGTCISNNVIHSISSYTYGGWGLYNDEGSEGIVWENNLVYDTKDASYHQHYGRDNVVRNNILVCAEKCQLAVSLSEAHRSVTFDRNIVYWEDDAPVYRDPMWMTGIVDGTAKVDWTNNVFWCASGPTVVNAPHPAIVTDPLFVDAKADDFRLKPDTPVTRFGFKPWDIGKSGRRNTLE